MFFPLLFFSELVSCHPVSVNNSLSDGHKSKRTQHYIELCLKLQDAVKRPRVRCLSEEMSQKASRHVSLPKFHQFPFIYGLIESTNKLIRFEFFPLYFCR